MANRNDAKDAKKLIFSESEPDVAFGYGEAPMAGDLRFASTSERFGKGSSPSEQLAHIAEPLVLKYRQCPLQP